MSNRILLLREAARKALLLRRSLAIPRESPINAFDIATSAGIEVQFADLPSLEGMFYRGPDPKIILPSLKHRSRGRVSYSCAHELGHFHLGHGTRVDEYLSDTDEPLAKTDEEAAADTFAATLLMPRPAVLERFFCRGWLPETAAPMELFCVSLELDVGYTTLIKHIRFGLGLVTDQWLKERKRVTPKTLRQEIANRADCKRLVVVDGQWPSFMSVDLEVGDCIALPEKLHWTALDLLLDHGRNREWQIIQAVRPGQARLTVDGVSLVVRIARSGYCGLLRYRYMDDSEES